MEDRFNNLSLSKEMTEYFKSKASDPPIISPDEGAKYLVEKEKGAKIVNRIREE